MIFRRVEAGLLVLALAGCGTIGDGTDGRGVAVEDIRGTGLGVTLGEYARLRGLPSAELVREQESARRAFQRSRNDGNRVRYALALIASRTTASEEARALDALEPVVQNRNSAWHGLAVLVSSLLHEQRRRDAQAQGLQQKLDALLTLERNMIERESEGARRR